MLKRVAPREFVTVTRIDRLARTTSGRFGSVKRMVDAKAQSRSLAKPWADTSTSTGCLSVTVLRGLVDAESDLIRPAPRKALTKRRSAASTWAHRRIG